MSYISEIFERLNIQHICEFLLYGTECAEVSDKTYKQRVNEAEKAVSEMIKSKFPDINEYEELTNKVHNYASVTQNVYMEIGIQCGALLTAQLLVNPQKE